MKKRHALLLVSILSFYLIVSVLVYKSDDTSSQQNIAHLKHSDEGKDPFFNMSEGHLPFVVKVPQEAELKYAAFKVKKIVEQNRLLAVTHLETEAGHRARVVHLPSKEVIKYASLRKIPAVKLVETNALVESEKIIASLESKSAMTDASTPSAQMMITKTDLSTIQPIKHTISAGDTLSSISEQYHTTIWKIRKLNNLKRKALLKVGRVLTVLENEDVLNYANLKEEKEKKWLASVTSELSKIALNKVKSKAIGTFMPMTDSFISRPDQNSMQCERMISVAKTKLGRRYVWGASGTQNTYDCSSFTKFVYKSIGIYLPRTSIRQSKYGKYVKREELKRGDLIFFDTSKEHRGYVNHVGIYLGDNRFIHASSAKKKVVISKLEKNFYSQRYKGARRPS
ncbi:MAG: hypothetical protein RL113_74 [Pseudomonadota bacterium]